MLGKNLKKNAKIFREAAGAALLLMAKMKVFFINFLQTEERQACLLHYFFHFYSIVCFCTKGSFCCCLSKDHHDFEKKNTAPHMSSREKNSRG